jgi:radical SAM protein with 4Fe4S-binding SPASM domain
MSPEEILSYTSSARRLGANTVKFTGGEPLLREDLPEIYAGIVGQGYSVSIETNGTIIDEDQLSAFDLCKPMQVSVSIDSASEREHDDFRGATGSWARACEFVGELVSRGISTQIIASTADYSVDAVHALFNLARRLKANSLRINPITPLGRGEQLDTGRYRNAHRRISFAREVHERYNEDVRVSMPEAFLSLDRLRCKASCSIDRLIGILPDGKTSFCGIGYSRPDLIFGDLRQQPLGEIWSYAPLLKELRAAVPWGIQGICSECIHLAHCKGYCVMENYVLSGSFRAPNVLCSAAEEQGLFPPSRKVPTDESG